MSVRCTRRVEFDAMHRIPEHENKCSAWHGHRYAVEIQCSAPELDACGRVIDFGVVKTVVGGWIDRHWDHTAIIMRGDPDPAAMLIASANEARGRPVYWMDHPPSAENLVRELARVATDLLAPTGVEVVRIRLWETPNCSAEWTRD